MDTQLALHYGWGVNGRLKQLDAAYPDSYGSGTPAVSHSRSGYGFGKAADGDLLAWLLRLWVEKEGMADPVGPHFASETLPDQWPSVTSHPLRAPTAACTPTSCSATVNLIEPVCRNSHAVPFFTVEMGRITLFGPISLLKIRVDKGYCDYLP